MEKLKIATFNLCENKGEFPKRIEQIPNNIRKNEFDIICFQGDFSSKSFKSSSFLNIELDFNSISTKTRRKFRACEYSSSNLTVLSKYKISLLKELYFKEEEKQRACQFLELEFNSEKILLINTQLCFLSSKNRIGQIKEILKYVNSFPYETKILCGNLNALPLYEEIKLLKKFGFKNKNSDFTHKDKVILDYIFYKSKKAIKKVESQVILKGFSEHYCLVNKIIF